MPAATLALVPGAAADAGTPEWWLRRLHRRLLDRRSALDTVWRYYKGDFEWRYADRELKRVFGPVFYQSRFGINWMKLIVGAVEERLQVQGFRVGGSKEADPQAWDIWQHNNLDEQSSIAHMLALIFGSTCATVWMRDGDQAHPRITVEHPALAVVEMDPRDRQERSAGLRMHSDPLGYLHAELFLPEAVYVWRSARPYDDPARAESAGVDWTPDADLASGMENPLGVVPMVEFTNMPTPPWPGEEDGPWLIERSELYGVLPIQDAINSTLMNILLVGNSQGYRQRWVTGLDVEYNADGTPKQPFKAGLDRLLQASSPDTRFGEFNPTDVTPLIRLLDNLVHALAAAGQVPPHYLSASADRLSGESIRAAESGLISKVRRKQVSYGGSWEEVLRLAGMLARNPALAESHASETMWANAETRTLSQTYDAALKAVTIGVPWQARMEMLGYSPEQIARMRVDLAAEQLTAALAPPAPSTGAPPPPAAGLGPLAPPVASPEAAPPA